MTAPAAASPAALIAELYARAQNAARPAAPDPATPGAAPAETFAGIAENFLANLRQTEDVAKAGLAGKAEPQSVVMALASTELAIETAVTLRDRVVEAYQEILRMPV
jgi:flagellar hook-basal body complex protein FliE